MTLKPGLILSILAVALLTLADALCAAGVAGGAEQKKIEELLGTLRATPAHRRRDVMREVIELGEEAVPPLIREASSFKLKEEANYVACCVRALGELKAKKATDVLLQALRAPNVQIRYAAAQSLGQIWAWKEGAPLDATLPKVNVALLACVFEGEPTLEKLGACLALVDINDVKLPTDPKNLSIPQLREELQKWMAKAESAVPPLEQQPWQLKLRKVLTGSGQDAKNLLVRDKSLEAVDEIVAIIKTQTLSGSILGDLSDLLTGITGVAYPRDATPATSQAVVADKWVREWYKALCERKTDACRLYVFNKFEMVIDKVKTNPLPALLLELDRLKVVLMHQLDAPADIPADASAEARKILEELLGAKQLFIESLKKIQKAERGTDKVDPLQKLSEHVASVGRSRIAWLFVPQLVELATQEQNEKVLEELRRLLTAITGVPLPLTADMPPEKRKPVIEQWRKEIKPPEDIP